MGAVAAGVSSYVLCWNGYLSAAEFGSATLQFFGVCQLRVLVVIR